MYGRISRATMKKMLLSLGIGSNDTIGHLLELMEGHSLFVKYITYGNTM